MAPWLPGGLPAHWMDYFGMTNSLGSGLEKTGREIGLMDVDRDRVFSRRRRWGGFWSLCEHELERYHV